MGYFQHPNQALHPLEHVGYDPSGPAVTAGHIKMVLDQLQPVALHLDNYHLHDAGFAGLVQRYAAFHHPDKNHRPKGTLSQVYSRSTALKLVRDYEKRNDLRFDRVICTRWDIDYTVPINLETLEASVISMDGMYGSSVISDAWACGPSDAMSRWACQFDAMDQLAAKGTLNLGPHEWLRAHFDEFLIPWTNRPDVGIWIRR